MHKRVALTKVRLLVEPGVAGGFAPDGRRLKGVRPKFKDVEAGTPLALTDEQVADLGDAVARLDSLAAAKFGFGPGSDARFNLDESVVGAGANEKVQSPAEKADAKAKAAGSHENSAGNQLEAERGGAGDGSENAPVVAVDDKAGVLAKIDAFDTHKELNDFVEKEGLKVPEGFKDLKVVEKRAAIKQALTAAPGDDLV